MHVQKLGQEDPLEEEMPTHLSVLTGIILWTEEPGGPQSTGFQSQTRLNYINYINTEIHTHNPSMA